MNLKDKNIILTGGSLGIGKETAKTLLKKGANVLITGRSLERLKNSFKTDKIKVIEFDIGDIENIKKNTQKCLEILDNKVDVLINNVGIGVRSSLEDLNINDFLKVFNVNVFGLCYLQKKLHQ